MDVTLFKDILDFYLSRETIYYHKFELSDHLLVNYVLN